MASKGVSQVRLRVGWSPLTLFFLLIGSSFSFRLFLSPIYLHYFFVLLPLSKTLRGHIVPHFLRSPLTPHSLFTALRSLDFLAIFLTLYLLSKILRGHIVPHFLSFSLLSLLCLYVFTSLYSESYPRLCVGILLRTFLDSLFSYLLLTSFLAPYILKFYPLTSFVDFVFSFYPSSSLYLRFCVSILFRTFLGFGISPSFSSSVLCLLYFFVSSFSVNYSDSAWVYYSTLSSILPSIFFFNSLRFFFKFYHPYIAALFLFSSSPFYTFLSFILSRSCVDILFRTFLEELILRGHFILLFLRFYPSSSSSIPFGSSLNFLILVLQRCFLFSPSPFYTFLSFILSRSCVDILFRTFLEELAPSSLPFLFLPIYPHFLYLLSLPYVLHSFLLLSCDSAWTYCSALSQDTSYLPSWKPFSCESCITSCKFVLSCFLLPVISKLSTLRSKNLVSLS